MTPQTILIDSDSDSDLERLTSSQPKPDTIPHHILSSSQERIRDSSPDLSFPSFRHLFRSANAHTAHHCGTSVAGTFLDTTDASPARLTLSNRANTLRRITSLPTNSPSQQQRTAAAVASNNAAPIEIIDLLGSDSICAPSDRAAAGPDSDPFPEPEPSSPILSQFTLARPSSQRQHASDAVAAAKTRLKALQRATSDARRAGPSRTPQDAIILDSSPDPPQRRSCRTATSSTRVDRGTAPAEKTFRLLSSPPPSSPIAEHSKEARASTTASTSASTRPTSLVPGSNSRSGSLQRKPSLLDALDALQTLHEAAESSDDSDTGHAGPVSPSSRSKRIKAQFSSPEKQRKRSKPGQAAANAAAARLFSSDTENDAAATSAAAAARLDKAAAARATKEAEKEARRLEREFKKAERERAAAEKKRWSEANKLRRGKGDTMKELIVEIDERLCVGAAGTAMLKPCYETIKERMERDGAAVSTFRHDVIDTLSSDASSNANSPTAAVAAAEQGPATIRFRRKVAARLDPVRRSWIPLDTATVEQEKVLLVLLDGKEVVQMVEESRLIPTMQRVRDALPSKGFQLFLVIHEMHKHFSRLKANENRAYAARIRSALASELPPGGTTSTSMTMTGTLRRTVSTPNPSTTTNTSGSGSAAAGTEPGTTTTLQDRVEMTLMRLQVWERCFIVHANGLVDLTEWLCTLTADISLRPYKVVRCSFLSFCADGNGGGSSAGTGMRNTTGSNELETFKLMLMQIPRVTSHVSTSITSLYPTLTSLYSAYAACSTQEEMDYLLADCHVDTNINGTARASNRRGIGSALSKRIAGVLMGQNALGLVGGSV